MSATTSDGGSIIFLIARVQRPMDVTTTGGVTFKNSLDLAPEEIIIPDFMLSVRIVFLLYLLRSKTNL